MSDDVFTVKERRQLGCARAQHAAFDAIYALWEQRQEEGLTQNALAELLGRDPAWLSRTLSGPGNWTLRTFGELAEALDGYIDLKVQAREKLRPINYDIYSDLLDGVAQVFCPITAYSPKPVIPNDLQSQDVSKAMHPAAVGASDRNQKQVFVVQAVSL